MWHPMPDLIYLDAFFKTNVYSIQGLRPTQGKGLLNENCDMNVRGNMKLRL